MKVRFHVFVDDDADRAGLLDALGEDGEIVSEDGDELLVEATPEALERVAARDLSLLLPSDAAAPAVFDAPREPVPAASEGEFDQFRRWAFTVDRSPDGGLAAGLQAAVVYQPDIHGVDDADRKRVPREPRPIDVYVVRLQDRAAVRRAAEIPGKLLERVDERSLRYLMNRDELARAADLAFVTSIRPNDIGDVVAADLVRALVDERRSLEAAGQEDVETRGRFMLRVVEGAEPEVTARFQDEIERVLERTEGISDVQADGLFFRFSAPRGPILSAIANMPQVAALEEYVDPELSMERTRAVMGVEAYRATWTGEGETAGIFDSGVDVRHPDLAGRVSPVPYLGASDEDRRGHGTHVAGILAGNGSASGGRLAGMAPKAKLVSVSVCDRDGNMTGLPPDIGSLLALATDEGARVCNLSWGFPLRGAYDQAAYGVDQFVNANPEVLVVVAAGNSGSGHQSVDSPGTAKNAVSVGALEVHADKPENAVIWEKSARGPTSFGSVKPDVLAVGAPILAALSSEASDGRYRPLEGDGRYGTDRGTSMAAPVISGAALLLRELLRKERGVARPSAALIKALLVACSRPFPGPPSGIGYPDFDQGFGVPRLQEILEPTANGVRRFVFADVPAGHDDSVLRVSAPQEAANRRRRRYTFEIPDGAITPLVVVLTWIDPPGRDVQNVLRLEVRGPGMPLRYGNHDHASTVYPGIPVPDGYQCDRRNNTQIVRVDEPKAGRYRVDVRALETPAGGSGQGYALCAVGSFSGELERG